MTGEQREAWRKALAASAVIGAIFCLLVMTILWYNHLGSRTQQLVDANEIVALKEALRMAPRDEALKTAVRELDQRLRDEYFRRRAFARRGVWLLLLGAAAMVTAASGAGALRPMLPQPRSGAPSGDRQAALSRWAVAVMAAVFVVAAVSLPSPSGFGLPSTAETMAPPLASPIEATPDTQWPRFRGPMGGGIAPSAEAPTDWDLATGRNLLWKVAVPLPGMSSPIVWGDRVILTGATADRREVYGFEAATGRLLWRTPISGGARAKPESIMEDTGYAAPTPATDGERVYVMFANGDVAGLTFDGKLLWAANLGVPENLYGHATSPVPWRDKVVIQFDQGHGGDGKSRLYLLEGATGQIVYAVEREEPNLWSTPIVVPAEGGDQIVVTGSPWVRGYDAATGAELWKADLFYGEVVTSPIFANGLVYVATAMANAAAIRLDGRGDVTASHVVWRTSDGLPDIATPLSDGQRLLLCSQGALTCLDAATGETRWEEFVDGTAWASPILVGDRVYLSFREGDILVFTMHDGYRELARLPIGEALNATPTAAGGRLYVRGARHLFCFAEEAP